MDSDDRGSLHDGPPDALAGDVSGRSQTLRRYGERPGSPTASFDRPPGITHSGDKIYALGRGNRQIDTWTR